MEVLICANSLGVPRSQPYIAAPKEVPGQHVLWGLIIGLFPPSIFYSLGPLI